MTDNEKIIYKAIMKAEKCGYRGHLDYLPLHLSFINGEKKKKFTKKKFMELVARIWNAHLEEIIFSHEFAKAFFGEKMFAYRTCLQDMVLEEDRIKYIEKFL